MISSIIILYSQTMIIAITNTSISLFSTSCFCGHSIISKSIRSF